MKNRLGVLALAALLAACTGQSNKTVADGPKAHDAQSGGLSSGALQALSKDAHRAFANAPDRGALLTYTKQAAIKQHGAYTLLPVQLSEEHAIRGVVTGLMTVPAPDGSNIKIRYDRTEEGIDGNWSWIGSVVGGDAGQKAIITFGENAVSGTIPQAVGPALSLKTENGVAYMVQADASRLKKVYRAGGDIKVRALAGAQDSSSEALVAAAKTKAVALANADVSSKAFSAANTIDLVVGYSNGFVSANSGASGAATRISELVAISNQALLDSKVNARIRVVSAIQVNYADNTDNGIALDQLTGNDGNGPVTVPAALAPLRAARDEKGADLVTLIRDFQPENQGCGIAWLLGANGAPITAADDAPFGYSVVSDGNYLDTNNYFCENISLIHEIAHNMGEAHDIANAGGISGRFPYSYGYKTTAAAGNFFTVMAYGDDNQAIYRVFSNPNITICGGFACGIANQADNARSLNQTVPIIATFRATVVPIGGAVSDFNGDGVSDILWRNLSSGRSTIWKSANSTTEQGVATLSDLTWKMVGSGDFDGDGITDILWRNSSTGRNSIWKSGNSTKLQAVATVADLTWTVAGVGDFNKDGKADIVWRNIKTGRNSIWLSGNTATQRRVATLSNLSYKIVGIGDFNGDGIADILWRNTANGRNSVWKSGLNTSLIGMTTVTDQRWTVVGVGDFDGDGKSDVLWRHTVSGANSIWKSANSRTPQLVASVTDQRWKVAAIGDYSGDGQSDILWRHSLTGANTIWRSGLVANPQTVTAVTNLDYAVQK
ncbi:FG-GAP-like repeat-containing protein [Pseudoxanthomonas yeongjuensis]|uniref:FG-GAP-like repeat-containing protein n=1 Tax=Pseudoxanthomonas yeongjuensis TaxID=377616 RepID=UPI001391D07D|nr:FG-GAP-like repeat-containing protein [Pseudoxanthomonas yeongjuensis]